MVFNLLSEMFNGIFGNGSTNTGESYNPAQTIGSLFQGNPLEGAHWAAKAFPDSTPPWAPWHPDYESGDDIEEATRKWEKSLGINTAGAGKISHDPSVVGVSGTTPPGLVKGPPGETPNQRALRTTTFSGDIEDDMASNLGKIATNPNASFPIAGKSIADMRRHGKTTGSRTPGAYTLNAAGQRVPIRQGKGHAGYDFAGGIGESYFAHQQGTVVRTFWGKGYGWTVDIKFNDGTIHRVSHLGTDDAKTVKPFGDHITAGAIIPKGAAIGNIGYSGNAGKGFPHAHVEIFKNEKAYKTSLGMNSKAGLKYRVTDEDRDIEKGGKWRGSFTEYWKRQMPAGKSYLLSPNAGGLGLDTPKGIVGKLSAYSPVSDDIYAKGMSVAKIPKNLRTPDEKALYKKVRMESGNKTSRKGLDGQAVPSTVHQYAAGDSNFITLAGNPKFYGRKYNIPVLPYTYLKDGKWHVELLYNVTGVVHDTGGRFKKASSSRFDVALGLNLSNKEMAKNADLWQKFGVEFQEVE